MSGSFTKPLMDHWSTLAAREQRMLLGGSLMLVVLLVIFLFWIPLQERLHQGKLLLKERQAMVLWMDQSKQEVLQLRATQGTKKSSGTQKKSLLSLSDQTAREQGLGETLKRVEPEGSKRVRLWFEKVSFDQLLTWLATLNQHNGVQVEQLTLEKEEETPGKVRVRLVLGGPGK